PVIRFNEIVLITHIHRSVKHHASTGTILCDIHSGLHSVLLLIRVHPLRVTGPVIDHRRPWRHNTTTVASNRPNQTTIRVVIMTVVESQSSRRRPVSLLDVLQAPFGLTSGSRLNST